MEGLCEECQVVFARRLVNYPGESYERTCLAVFEHILCYQQPLHKVCAHVFVASELVPVNGTDDGIIVPLYSAAYSGSFEGVTFLLTEYHVDIHRKCGVLRYPALVGALAIRDKDKRNAMCALLMEHGARMNYPNVSWPEFCIVYRNQLARCRMAQRALERVLRKSKVICKDLIPNVVDMVWETRKSPGWNIKK